MDRLEPVGDGEGEKIAGEDGVDVLGRGGVLEGPDELDGRKMVQQCRRTHVPESLGSGTHRVSGGAS